MEPKEGVMIKLGLSQKNKYYWIEFWLISFLW